MKIHILSDLHNEFCKFQAQPVNADVIVLAGDIDKGARSIAWARLAWPDKKIVFVPGNHEYYGSEINYENEQMAKAGEIYEVHVLNPGEVIIDGVRFLGATLWTDFRLFGEAEIAWAMLEGMNYLSDFNVIYYDERTFSPSDAVKLHERDVKFLSSQLCKKYDGQTVVVTHHLPSMHSVANIYKKNMLSACFASNLDTLMGHNQLWIHGHTHDSFDYLHPAGTRVVCNPRGYSGAEGDIENFYFLSSLVVEF